jgi:hypothetical protein
MNPLHRTFALFLVIAVPAAAHSYFIASAKPCFTAGRDTYQIVQNTLSPDYRIKIGAEPAQSDLRVVVVDLPEQADFAIVDDVNAAAGDACKAAGPVRTIRVDANYAKPDVSVALTRDSEAPDYRIYVHSARYSHHDAAALVAAMWKTTQTRNLAERERIRAAADVTASIRQRPFAGSLTE